jgi:hypothetical protein
LRTDQGEALAVWALWGIDTALVLVTYTRLSVDELYHVSNEGLAGGLSRTGVLLNFPIALVAIAAAVVAAAVLPRRAWWIAGPAIALSAVVAWPGVVDQDDLDVKVVNALPAAGVVLALGLTVAAARREGAGFAPRRRGDPIRLAVTAVTLFLSLPWIAAELGFFLGGGVFLTEPAYAERNGEVLPAVHLGHHHGFDGALLLVSALLLSRMRPPRYGVVFSALVGAMAAYGAVNCVQDTWHEQLVKRGWLEWDLPSALVPRAHWIWLVSIGLAVGLTLVIRREQRSSVRLS